MISGWYKTEESLIKMKFMTFITWYKVDRKSLENYWWRWHGNIMK